MTFKLFGFSIRLSYPLICAVTVLIVLDKTGTAFASCFSAFLHELGHLITLTIFSANNKDIILNLFNANIKSNSVKLTIGQEIMVSLSGPIINLTFFLISFALFYFFPYNSIKMFMISNLVLFLFNSLPIDTLDGGNALYLFLTKLFSLEMACKIITIVSFIFLVPLSIVGFYLLIQTRYNFTLLLICTYLIATIIFKNSKCKIGG